MPAFAVFFLVGVLTGLVFKSPGSGLVSALLLVTGIVGWWLFGRLFVALVAGVWLGALASHDFLDHALVNVSHPMEMIVRGVISDIPVVGDQSTSFTLDTTGFSAGDPALRRIRLSLYKTDLRPVAGENWQFHVRLKPVHGQVNPGAFDRATWLFVNGVHATGHVVESSLNQQLPGLAFSMARVRSALKLQLERLLSSSQANTEQLPLLMAITIGFRGDFTHDDWALFRETGTSHLMAISGLHVGLVGLLMWHAGGIIGRLSGMRHAERLSVCLSLSGALFYSLLAGMAVSTVRALIMMMLMMVAFIRRRCSAPVSLVSIAIVIVLMIQPVMVFSAAFWLSFAAVTLLITLCAKRPPDKAAPGGLIAAQIIRMLRVQCLLCVGLAVPVAIFFSEVPLASVPANLIAVPVFSLVTVPAALSGILMSFLAQTPAEILLQVSLGSLSLIYELLGMLAVLPVINVYGVIPSAALLILTTGACVAGLMLRSWLLLGSCLCLCLLSTGLQRVRADAFELHVLDVGQGLSLIVRVDERVLIYDTGPSWPGGDTARTVILPVLRKLGIRYIDTVLISHGDNDHAGSFKSLVHEFQPAKVISAEQAITGSDVTSCHKGMIWHWGEARFEILHPRQPFAWDENNGSCVLQISIDQFSLLLPGDIESEAELVLSGRKELRPSQVVIAPHHGSRTSSSAALVDSLSAGEVIFTTGYLNRWSFPAREVVLRWQKAGACVSETAISGAIRIGFSPEHGFRIVERAAMSLWRPWPVRPSAYTGCPNVL